MKEVFVIYNKTTGFIDGGAGRIDREWDQANADGSTISERIPEILVKNPNRKVIYLSYQSALSPSEYLIKSGGLKKMTASEKAAYQTSLPKPKIQELEERITVLESP